MEFTHRKDPLTKKGLRYNSIDSWSKKRKIPHGKRRKPISNFNLNSRLYKWGWGSIYRYSPITNHV
jgi:hypothetical protein